MTDAETPEVPPPTDEDAPDWDEDTGEVIDAADPDGAEAEPINLRADFLKWMTTHLALVEVGGNREGAAWCAQWWEHPEAVARLWALYKAYKQATELSDSLASLSDWWVHHWDWHRVILFDALLGPFRDCENGHLEGRRNKDELLVSMTQPPNAWSPPDSRDPRNRSLI